MGNPVEFAKRWNMYNETMQKLGEERSEIREIFEYGNARASEIGRENVFDFSLGNPSIPAPASVNQEIVRLLESVPSVSLHGYTSAPGAAETRGAVADYICSAFGIPMKKELVYMTCGAASSLMITFRALCEKGDEFVVVAPYFPEYKMFIESAGGVVKSVCSDDKFHLDFAALGEAIGKHTKAVIINSPNNPSGVIYEEEELKTLAALLAEKSREKGEPVFLISDEPYREISYGKKVPYVMNFYADSIVCYSFSKSLSLAGERIGYIAVCPACERSKDLFSAICGAGRALGYVCAPSLFQRVIAANLGAKSDIEAYRANRDLLLDALEDCGFVCVPPDGAFYLFMKSPEENARAFCERAKKYELLFVPSDSFGITGYVRIAYCVERDMIVRSLPAFRELAREYGLNNRVKKNRLE